jgi:AAA family ATP:ADP antiporter
MRFLRVLAVLCLAASTHAVETRTGEQAPAPRPVVAVTGAALPTLLPNLDTKTAPTLEAIPQLGQEQLSLPVLERIAASPESTVGLPEQQAARLALTLDMEPVARAAMQQALAKPEAVKGSAVALLASVRTQLADQKKPDEGTQAALLQLDTFFSGLKTNPGDAALSAVRATPPSKWRASLAKFKSHWLGKKTAAVPPPLRPGEPGDAQGPPPGENKLVRWAFLWNFATIAAYTIIGAVKQGMLMHRFGESIIPLVYIASALITGIAVGVYERYVGKVSRKALVRGTLIALGVTLAAWTGAIFLLGAANPWLTFGFSLWADVFGIMSVTLFWSYINDAFTPEAAKRRFGLIGAAGPLGSVLGSLLTLFGAVKIGLTPLLGAATVLFGSTLFFFAAMDRLPHPKFTEPAPTPEQKRQKGILKVIAASPYLIFLSMLVALERMVPDFSNYLFSAVTRGAYPTAEALTRFSGMFGLVQGVFSLAASVFLTKLFLKKIGVGPALMSSPLANLIGFVVYPFAPALPWTVGYNGVEGLFRYTTFKAAKEATYTTQDHNVIYRVKAFIEMFLYRLARGLAGVILLLLTGKMFLGLGAVSVAWTGAGLALLWLYAAWRVGREAKLNG